MVAHLYEISSDGKILTLFKKDENEAYYWHLEDPHNSRSFTDIEQCHILKNIPHLPNNFIAHYSDSLHLLHPN